MINYKITGKTGISNIEFRDILNSKLPDIFPNDTIFITDKNIHNLYEDFFNSKDVIILSPGEKSKKVNTLIKLIDKLIQHDIDRNSHIVGVGGGVISDLTGFVGSIYMRGIKFSYIPTTLLAMIDASIGGKTGINFGKYKNMIGTFQQPQNIFIDHKFLNTLPEAEYINGMAEAIKHMLIVDNKGFRSFSENISKFKKPESKLIPEFIEYQAKIKIDIVNQDETEKGIRSILNFGHTFGHAIEKLYKLKHGFAISVGMVIAAKISEKMNFISSNDVTDIIECLEKTGLPVTYDINKEEVIKLMSRDKKKQGFNINFIALEKIGKAKIVSMKIEELITLFLKIN